MIIAISFAGITGFFAFEKFYLSKQRREDKAETRRESHSH